MPDEKSFETGRVEFGKKEPEHYFNDELQNQDLLEPRHLDVALCLYFAFFYNFLFNLQ